MAVIEGLIIIVLIIFIFDYQKKHEANKMLFERAQSLTAVYALFIKLLYKQNKDQIRKIFLQWGQVLSNYANGKDHDRILEIMSQAWQTKAPIDKKSGFINTSKAINNILEMVDFGSNDDTVRLFEMTVNINRNAVINEELEKMLQLNENANLPDLKPNIKI